jgi:hypothetical protein
MNRVEDGGAFSAEIIERMNLLRVARFGLEFKSDSEFMGRI